MNFFFGIKSKEYECELKIPKFANNGKLDKEIRLFQAKVENKQWIIEDISYLEEGNFYILKNENIDNHKIFFLAKNSEIFTSENSFQILSAKELIDYSNFTDTEPDYRSNLRIYNENTFSSYQSDYPYKMIKSRGSILSSVYPLCDINADINKIFFRNIYFLPEIKEFFAYLIDFSKKKNN